MLRTLSPDVLAHENSQTLEKANHLIATLRISRAYLAFCAVMSLLSCSLLVYTVCKLAKHGVSGLKMHVDLTEELMELAVCSGILIEVLWALRLMPLRVFLRVGMLQLDVCVFIVSALSAALTSANLAAYLGLSHPPMSDGVVVGLQDEGESEEYLRGASAALLLFRFLLQIARAILAMRNAWQLSRERQVAMEDIVLPEIPCCGGEFSPVVSVQMIGHSKGGFVICSSEAECV